MRSRCRRCHKMSEVSQASRASHVLCSPVPACARLCPPVPGAAEQLCQRALEPLLHFLYPWSIHLGRLLGALRLACTSIYQAFGMELTNIEQMWMLIHAWTKSDAVPAKSIQCSLSVVPMSSHDLTVTWLEGLPWSCCVACMQVAINLANGLRLSCKSSAARVIKSEHSQQSRRVQIRPHILTVLMDSVAKYINLYHATYKLCQTRTCNLIGLGMNYPYRASFGSANVATFSLVYKRTRLNLLLLQNLLVPGNRRWGKSVSPCFILFDIYVYIYT